MSDINGHPILRASGYLPRLGVWSTQVDVAEDVLLAAGSSATVTLGDLVLVGTVVDGGPVNGLASYHVRAGKGAWDRVLPPRAAFQSDPGVKYATVFRWLMEQTGETIATDIPADLRIPGLAWVPRGGPAWDTLRLLSVSWYVDNAGVTQVRERPSAPVSHAALLDAQLIEHRPEDGTRIYQTDAPGAFPPGGTIEGERIEQVWLDATDSQITLTLYSGSPSHGPATSFDRIVAARTPEAFYRGIFEYAVVSQDGPRLGVRPVSTGPALGTIDRIFPWPGAAGSSADLTEGSSAILAFLDGRPSKPIIVGYSPPSAPGGIPVETRLQGHFVRLGAAADGPPGKLVAREADATRSGQIEIQSAGTVLAFSYTDENGLQYQVNITAVAPPGGGAVAFVAAPLYASTGPIVGKIQTPSQGKVFA